MAVEAARARRLFTREEYHRMGEVGILKRSDRVELIRGEIVEKCEPNGRQASCDFLLDGRDDAPVAPLKSANENLGVAIASNENHEIGIARQSRFGPGRHGQTANQRELAAELEKIRDDSTERGFGAAQRRGGGQEMARPQLSPCSAPGRVSSQAISMASISSSLAWGCSRRSWARRIDSPSAQSSNAVRKRAATASAESSTTDSL